jgi:hypothetical protein
MTNDDGECAGSNQRLLSDFGDVEVEGALGRHRTVLDRITKALDSKVNLPVLVS